MCCPITDPLPYNRSGAEFLPCSPPSPSSCRLPTPLALPCRGDEEEEEGGVANLPLPAQLLGTDKKSFELWSLPLISAWGRPRCCPPASKAPPGFCPPAVARPLDSQLIFFLPAPAAQSRSRGRAFFFFFLSRPVPTSWGRAGHWVSGCRRCVSCEMKR